MKRFFILFSTLIITCLGWLYYEKHQRFGFYFDLGHGIPNMISACPSSHYSNVLYIGDSVTEGHIYDYPRSSFWGIVDTLFSYPHYLNLMEDWHSTNAGISGSTPSTWYNRMTSHVWKQKTFREYDYSSYDLFIIEFGYNSVIEQDDPNQEYDYYCKIIEEILSNNECSNIILLISPYLDAIHPQNAQTIMAISQKYDTQLYDLRETDLMDKRYHGFPFTLNRNKVHFTAKGYYHKAELIKEFIQRNN